MKHWISVTLLTVCCLTVHGSKTRSIKNPQWIVSNHPSFVISHITLTDTATILKCHFESEPHARFSIRSSMHLEDEHGHTSPVIRVDEFPLDSIVVLPEHGGMDFTIRFKPLADGTRVFDLIESLRRSDFRIYGISCTKKIPVIPQADEECDFQELSSHWFRPDSVWLTGQFVNYARNGLPHVGRIGQTSHRIDPLDRETAPQVFAIDDEGHFTCGFAVDHPMWQWINLAEGNPIAFFARPGDTLHVEITDYGTEAQRVTYRTSNGLPAYPALMSLWGYTMNRQYAGSEGAYLSDNYKYKITAAYDSICRLYDYWNWKHHFSGFENRLFKNALRMGKILDCLDQQKVLFQSQWKRNMQQKVTPETYFTPAQMGFLREADWNDPSLAYTPFWLAFRTKWYESSDLMPMLHQAISTDGLSLSPTSVQRITARIAEYLPNITRPLLNDLISALTEGWAFPTDSQSGNGNTFSLNNQAAQAFLGAHVLQGESRLTHFIFVDAKQQSPKALNVLYNQKEYLFEDFADNPDLKVIVVYEQTDVNPQTEIWHQRYLPETPCVCLPTAQFTTLCAAFRVGGFPGDLTVTPDRQILRHSFLSTNESTFRSNLRNYIKREKKNAKVSAFESVPVR